MGSKPGRAIETRSRNGFNDKLTGGPRDGRWTAEEDELLLRWAEVWSQLCPGRSLNGAVLRIHNNINRAKDVGESWP